MLTREQRRATSAVLSQPHREPKCYCDDCGEPLYHSTPVRLCGHCRAYYAAMNTNDPDLPYNDAPDYLW